MKNNQQPAWRRNGGNNIEIISAKMATYGGGKRGVMAIMAKWQYLNGGMKISGGENKRQAKTAAAATSLALNGGEAKMAWHGINNGSIEAERQ
jgi:hypothetical protein